VSFETWWRWAGTLIAFHCFAPGTLRVGAQINPDGPVARVNTHTTEAQRAPVACRSPAGDVVVWQSAKQDGRGWGVFAQRFTLDGEAAGSEFRVPTYTAGNEAQPALACAADGSFAVVWHSDRNGPARGVFAQFFDAAGAPVGEEFQVNADATSDSVLPAACLDPDGNVVIVWQGYHVASRQDVFGRRFDRGGTPLGTEFRVNTHTTSSQGRPAVACDDAGTFVVVWDSDVQDGADFGIFGQRYNQEGEPGGFEFQINSTTHGSQQRAKLGMAPAGAFVVVWEGRADGVNGYGVFGQRFDPSAAPLGTEFRVGDGASIDQARPAAASDSDGNFVVVWSSDGLGGHLAAQRYASGGDALGPPAHIETPGRSPRNPTVASGPSGDFVVVWQAISDHGDDDVFAQRFTVCRNGVLDPGEECDDGNVVGGDCCAADCTFERADLAAETHLCREVPAGELACSVPEEGSGVPCSDGNLCTTNDYCAYGVCIGGRPLDCNDGDICTDDICRPSEGCAHLPNSAPCDDGDACTGPDVCRGGKCAGGPRLNCDDLNVCTDDSCDPGAGCVHEPNDAACDDGNACTTDDRCIAGSCIGGPPLDCTGGDPCSDGSCDVWLGCVADALATPCEDANPCTDDRCVAGIGCSHTAIAGPCDDGNPCTRSDTCLGGVCRGSDPVPCAAPDACHADGVCDPATGLCSYPAAPDGTPCEDGDPCTVGDRCSAGACVSGRAGMPFLVKDIRPGAGGSFPAELIDAGSRLFFRADDGETGRELWTSDGTAAGTRLVADLRPGSAGSAPAALTALGGRVFFTAEREGGVRRLWVSDGSAAGTFAAGDGSDAGLNPESLTAAGERLFFVAGGAHGRELWTSDGTSAGTRLVTDIRPGRCGAEPCSGEPAELTAVGAQLFFVASDGVIGREPWTSDGTREGTQPVADIRPGPRGSDPGFLTALGDTLYFAADDGRSGRELWRSDGTSEGTRLVRDIRPGRCGATACSSSPSYLTAVGEQLFFAAVTDQLELWRSGGEASGTVPIRSLPSLPYVRHAVDAGLFFRTRDTGAGAALWRSDGSEAGTVRLMASRPRDGSAEWLASSGGRVFFTAKDDSHEIEIWVSDGTPSGTTRLHDLNPGRDAGHPQLSIPASLTPSGRFLFFSAGDGRSGRELWALCP
jgi:ELWxxDGT repeat protein/cysteine-rich repeat protein